MFQPVPVFVGLRYSLAREHSFFVSFITWVSLGGVALGVLALITVLSVMNGFESELRSRLLSLSAHATLTAPEGAPIADWRDRLHELQGAPGLVGRGAVSRYGRDAEPSAGDGRRHRARHRPGPGAQGVDHRRRDARGQARGARAGHESDRARPDAGLSAASGRRGHGHGHDPGQRGGRLDRAAPGEFRGRGNLRGRPRGTGQRARADQSSRMPRRCAASAARPESG